MQPGQSSLFLGLDVAGVRSSLDPYPTLVSSHVEAQERVHELWHVWLHSERRHAGADCGISKERSQSQTERRQGAPAGG